MQARSHAYRRPSTASGRLSTAAAPTYHRPSPPQALAANRSEYWGTHGSVENSNPTSQGYHKQQQQQQYVSRRPQGGRRIRVRERPLSAGCHPTSLTSARSPNLGAATTTIAVKACTRNRAGIVRGGGREGRAAPPPTPPSPRSSSISHLATTPPAAPQHRQQQPTAVAAALDFPKSTPCIRPHEERRRRPSTAGANRNPAAECDAVEYGYLDHHYDDEPTVCVPVESPPVMSSGFRGVGRTTRSIGAGDDEGSHSVLAENVRVEGKAERLAAAAPQQYPSTTGAGTVMVPPNFTPPPNANRSTIYTQSSHSATRTAEVSGRRRRPASAAPPRSRTDNGCDEDLKGGGNGNGGCVDTEGRTETTRGRTAVRGDGRGVQRPRSASASTGRRAHTYGVDGAEQLCADRRSFGAFTPDSCGKGRPSPVDGGCHNGLVARARPQSASAAPPAVIPSFVVSEKQVLRFFGHLTEGERFVVTATAARITKTPTQSRRSPCAFQHIGGTPLRARPTAYPSNGGWNSRNSTD